MADEGPDISQLVPVSSAPSPIAGDEGPPLNQLVPVSSEDYYGSTGQQVIAGLEGVGQGVLGPIAPAVERAFGVKGEDIRGRQEANPITHGIGEAAGLVGGALIPGLEEANLASSVGKIGEAAKAGAGLEGLAATGVKAGAELSALAASTELSKAVEGDPNQTLGSAAVNIGLSGIIGGAGGVALGSVSPLWNKFKNVTGVGTLMNDFINETAALQQAKLNPEEALSSEFEAIPASDKNASAGVKLARWVNEKGASAIATAAGDTAGGAVGAGLGFLVGHPLVGGYLGEQKLGPILTGLVKPFAENAVDSQAAKSAVDYLVNVSQGQKILSDGVSNMFKSGSQVIAKDLIPDQESRNKLEKSLQYFQNPENALQVGGGLQHYLPEHASAAAGTASQAANYLQSLKPKQPVMAPLDSVPPIHTGVQAAYNRQLDIAQQPLMVLKHTKDGTLQPQDIQTLRTIYPGLHDSMINKITNEIIDKNSPVMPYHQKVSMNLLIGGAPLDGTMTPFAAQAVMHSATNQQTPQTGQGAKKASGVELKQINKVDSIYATKDQARQINSRKA